MKEIQKWINEHACELSMIRYAYGLNQVEAIIKVLDEGMNKNMDDTSDMFMSEEYNSVD